MPTCTGLRSIIATAVAAGVIAVPARRAEAAAFQLRENSTVSLGTAFAGAASAADTPATAFNNPAGMTELGGLQFYAGASYVAPSFTFHGTGTTVFGGPIDGTSSADGGHAAAVPFGYATYRLDDRIALGLALTSPFGLATYYGPDFIGRYEADKTQLTTIDVNPSIAVKITDWLSLGAGFSAQEATAEFATALNSSTIFAPPPIFPIALDFPDGLFHLRQSGNWAYGYNLGALIKLDPATQIGVTYRSRVQHDFKATADITFPFAIPPIPSLASGPATAKLTLPDTATLSLTHHYNDRLTAYGEFSWTNWAVFKSLNVYRTDGTPISQTPQNYQSTVYLSIGASYKLNDKLTLRTGAGFDVTPTIDKYRTTRVPDADRYLIAAGASYSLTTRTTVDIAYSHVFLERATVNEVSPTGDVLAGDYQSSIDLVSLGLRAAF